MEPHNLVVERRGSSLTIRVDSGTQDLRIPFLRPLGLLGLGRTKEDLIARSKELGGKT